MHFRRRLDACSFPSASQIASAGDVRFASQAKHLTPDGFKYTSPSKKNTGTSTLSFEDPLVHHQRPHRSDVARVAIA
eukprot:6213879-Pleurochrysis_carterae.AAC.2